MNRNRSESGRLLEKACDSLVLGIELFNRPSERGRIDATLMHLNHSFEMFMKAAILHRGGSIIDRKRPTQMIGFDACVRVSLSNGNVKYISIEQSVVLKTINALRDFAQHHLLDISESQVYVHVQSGVTVFRDLLKCVFEQELAVYLPNRVLPVSVLPPTTIEALFVSELEAIKRLLHRGQPADFEAVAKLRPLMILDRTISGKEYQMSDHQMQRYAQAIENGIDWQEIFPGAAAVEISTEGNGPTMSLRITNKEGIPTQYVPLGTPGAMIIATKRVNELDFYNLGATQVGEKVGLSTNKVVAVVEYLNVRSNPDYYRELKIGRSLHKRYSQKVIPKIRNVVSDEGIDKIWEWYKQNRRSSRKRD